MSKITALIRISCILDGKFRQAPARKKLSRTESVQGNVGVRVQDRDKVNVIACGVNVFVVPEELDDDYFGRCAKSGVVERPFDQVLGSYTHHNLVAVTLAKNVGLLVGAGDAGGAPFRAPGCRSALRSTRRGDSRTGARFLR